MSLVLSWRNFIKTVVEEVVLSLCFAVVIFLCFNIFLKITRLANFDAGVLNEGRRGGIEARQTAEAVKEERASLGATEAVLALKIRSLFFKNRVAG